MIVRGKKKEKADDKPADEIKDVGREENREISDESDRICKKKKPSVTCRQ